MKEILILRGQNVMPHELEWVVEELADLGGSQRAAAFSVPSGEEGERAVIVVESRGDDDATLYDKAVSIVARDRKCSTSYIQRKLAIGYNKAARLVEQMETQGVVSAANAVGKRDIMIEDR